VILLHGFASGPSGLREVADCIAEVCPDADIYLPAMPHGGRLWSLVPATTIMSDLLRAVDEVWESRLKRSLEPYEAITIVGYSFGAILARKLFVLGWGETKGAEFEDEFAELRVGGEGPIVRRWARVVRRIVLIAGVSRGWRLESPLSVLNRILWNFGWLVGNLIPRKPTYFDLHFGAPFLIQTRLQWLALSRRGEPAPGDVTVIQLLGTIDDFVSPEDNIDVSVDAQWNAEPNPGGRDLRFFYLEVPDSSHVSVVRVDSARASPSDRESAQKRREKLELALAGNRQELKEKSVSVEAMFDAIPPRPSEDTKNVVFVIHGIRDRGYWTKKLARKIKEHAGATASFQSITASYGYFPMLPFVLPWRRREKVQWLMDQYAETRAIYPNAEFHYVGHSNGTYLVAAALEKYRAARFKRIVFAGSVVRTNYDWSRLIREGRVEKVLNFVATSDWVVALFPKAFSLPLYRAFDLGSAGHDGFVAHEKGAIERAQVLERAGVYELVYVKGRHGAAIQEHEWDEIAEFVVRGKPPNPRQPTTYGLRNRWLVAGGWSAKWALVPIALCAVALYFSAVYLAVAGLWSSLLSPAWTLGAVVGLFAIYKFAKFVLLRV
jgi:pimeloyl-ACP methyl ester carboxylesterase